MVESAKSFEKALTKKGFQLERQTTDKLFFFYYQGKKTQIFTKISHGKGEDLRPPILSKIKGQMFLDSSAQLSSFIDCKFGHEDYIALLVAKGHITPQQAT